MIRFMSFSSGSCGNCYLLRGDSHGILIDAGVSLRRLKQALALKGLDFTVFDRILLTHDHADHVRHIGSYCKRLCKPVHATEIVHNALSHNYLAMPYISSCRQIMPIGEEVELDGIRVICFEVPHDSSQTVGYAIEMDGHHFVLLTDLGAMTPEAEYYAKRADTLVIESNYDVQMLMAGKYPYDLKMRICKGHGHLSNDDCAAALRKVWHSGLRNIFLCHLSENNNTPSLAYTASLEALESLGIPKGGVNLQTLPRREPSALFNIG